jgi:hypothetical protein
MNSIGAFGAGQSATMPGSGAAPWLFLLATAGLGYAAGGIKGAIGTPIAAAGGVITLVDVGLGMEMPKEMMSPQPPVLAWLLWVGIPAAIAAGGGALAYSGYKERRAQGRPLLSF